MANSIYLVVAISGRAIAQGLTSLGHSCVVVDGFADQDTIEAALVYKKVKRTRYGLQSNDTLQSIGELQNQFAFDGLLYDAALETKPDLLKKTPQLKVIGNSCQTLEDCLPSITFFEYLDKASIPYPNVRFHLNNDIDDLWLVKHSRSSGGLGVSPYLQKQKLAENTYLQKKIVGNSFSLTFLANKNEIFVLGFNTQWSESLNDGLPYVYKGAINAVTLEKEHLDTAKHYAELLTKEFKLLGLNSIDFICDGACVYVLEINPRIPASYELYETKYGALMREHLEVCKTKKLPTKKRTELLRAHAIIYAPKKVRIPEDFAWPLWTADRPHDGELISQYEPICSVFSGGKNSAQVREMIKTREQSIINKLS